MTSFARSKETMLLSMKKAFLHLPVGINNNLGDAFQPTQWENTLYKIQKLKDDGHLGEVMIGTKYVPSDEQITQLHDVMPNVWIFYGVNGSNETRRFSERERTQGYLRLCEAFDRVVLTLRPIIPNRNDRIEILEPLIELASRGKRRLHHGGFRDPEIYGDEKYDYAELRPQIRERCAYYGVKDFPKSCCLVADYNGVSCRTHTPSEPTNIDVLNYLGFETEISNGSVTILNYRHTGKLTKADICFARHICGTSSVAGNWNDFHKKLQMRGPDGQKLICTSGWFGWSRQVDFCEVNCDYCIVRPGMPIYSEAGDAGCSPLDLYRFYEHLYDAC